MKRNTRTIKLRKSERLLITLIILFGVLAPVITVAGKSILSRSNIEIERLKRKIEKQENINEGLQMQVNELASLSSIQNVAKEYGLSYNNDNIVVIR